MTARIINLAEARRARAERHHSDFNFPMVAGLSLYFAIWSSLLSWWGHR
jgi:hypothetical protein